MNFTRSGQCLWFQLQKRRSNLRSGADFRNPRGLEPSVMTLEYFRICHFKFSRKKACTRPERYCFLLAVASDLHVVEQQLREQVNIVHDSAIHTLLSWNMQSSIHCLTRIHLDAALLWIGVLRTVTSKNTKRS